MRIFSKNPSGQVAGLIGARITHSASRRIVTVLPETKPLRQKNRWPVRVSTIFVVSSFIVFSKYLASVRSIS